MKYKSTARSLRTKTKIALVMGLLMFLFNSSSIAQLGIYTFTGSANCPNQNPSVSIQPANAVFSDFTNVNATCDPMTDVFQSKDWNSGGSIDLTQYNEFTVTAGQGHSLTLSSLSFVQYINQIGSTTWALRSSVDNYATDIASALAPLSSQSTTVLLSPLSFTNITTVTFRLYLTGVNSNGTRWVIDDVNLNGIVSLNATTVIIVDDPADPTSNSPQCSNPGVTMSFAGTAHAGETWYWQTSPTGTSTVNSASDYTVTASGTYYVRSQNNISLGWSSGAGSITVIVVPDVSTPVFTSGAGSTRCQGVATVTYSATAINNTGIIYSLDAASISGGNSINPSTGDVTYAAGWSGTSIITATANGCNSNTSAVHTVSITAAVGTPVFLTSITSARCQGVATVAYSATAPNATGITYSLDAASIAGGNSIDASTGDVSYASGWSGTSIITATAAGCNGNTITMHTVSTTAGVSATAFALGATSTRCQGTTTVIYTATAINNTGITYSLDAASIAASNSIDAATGSVSYAAGWVGTSTITATASGCAGTATAIHTVTITAAAGTPVFALGTTSTRCQGSATINYAATATNTTGITYSIDAVSFNAGNSINSTNGDVWYASNWAGTTTITASAAGCNGALIATHIATIDPSVDLPVFTSGSVSTRCQGAGTVIYSALALNSTAITYTLDAASITGGNSIDVNTGKVTYAAGWSGTSVIKVSAAGCNGPVITSHTVTTTTTVDLPVFTLGTTSTRCQGSGSVIYAASATNNTGMAYSLNAAAVTGGNSINATTGKVTYAAGWSGTVIITATAAGCNGPTSATHTVTVTATVGIPVFTLGTTSIRCQGAGTVNYTAASTNNTGIIYSLDAAGIAGGNTINASTGDVTYVSTWNGTTTITASATGCNGPVTGNHTVTTNPGVGTPVFALGTLSVRTQGTGTVTYTATASNATSITYTLDPASIAGGNTINASTGMVTWNAVWNGTSMITASASGCSASTSASHIVTINPSIVQTPLYLSTPGQSLDRIDPVSTGIIPTLQTAVLSSTGTTNTSFTQSPALSGNLIIKAQTLSVAIYVGITSGSMPANPAITALLKYGSTNIISFNNPIYNGGTGMLTWTGILGTDVTVPSGQSLVLMITTAQAGVSFTISYHSMTKPSRISLLPVSTFIDITSFDLYSAPYPGGGIRTNGIAGTVVYARAKVTTPFGYNDITGLTMNITPQGLNVSGTCVDSSASSRIYEYAWTTPAAGGTYYLMATAKEGYENIIKNSELVPFSICTTCPPVANNDSASGAGGAPITVNVLANDYDPNNNIKVSTLAIVTQPNNGTGYLSNGKIVYLPNGTFAGRDTIRYRICDSTALCANGLAIFNIDPLIVDQCSDATKSHVYYIPYPEKDAYKTLLASSSTTMPSNNIRTVISLTMPYPGMTVVWDEWEDGYEANALNPMQLTTKVWGDGNPYNGIAPGYANDIIPPGGSIVLDNTMPANPRVTSNIFYDGRDKITASGQIAVTQVSGEPTRMPVQDIKTNVSSTFDFGQSFTVPLGQNYPDQDFAYTALFIRAAENGTSVSIDKDNNGAFDTTLNLNEGESYLVSGGVMVGATITSTKPIGVELNAGGIDQYSVRNATIFPASWYSNTYYTPVPTSDNPGDNPKDTSVIMFYNSLNRAISINWNSGAPANGVINLPAKTAVRFPLAYSTTAAYKFVNPTGESFTAIELVDSYTPGGGGNDGQTYDWAFNLISDARLTDFATTAWAPGGLDLVAPAGPDVNGNPIWVTPSANTTIYVKYDGKISGTSGSISPCGLRYDVAIPLNALNYTKIRDLSDNDQSGIAIYTCNGAKLAAVYGEDPQGSLTGIGIAYWDVGTTILPFCKQKLIFANDDYGRTMINQPVTIPILLNDFGFLSVIDPTSVTTTGYLQPNNGTVTINANGTVLYTPNPGYVGKDTFEYSVCSTPSPIVCDYAKVYVDISVCPAPFNENVVGGQVFNDKNKDGLNNDGGAGIAGAKVYLYVDGNCNTTIDANELKDSVTVDVSGRYQFITYPEKFVADDFDGTGGINSCATGSDGNAGWLSNWTDAGDLSVGFCNNSQSLANTDAEIVKDAGFTYALRLKDKNISATRTVKLTGASYAFLTFSYRRKSATLTAGKNIIVQASSNGSTFGTVYTIAGDGTTDAGYVTIYNQDITAYAAATTYIRFLTNNNVADADTVYIDNVKVQFLTYPQCYITKLDVTTVPANYHTTTVTQQNLTASSSQTCLSPYDFGIGKNTVTVSGTLFNDANGLVDNIINGTAMGTASGASVYAYMVDTSGKVIYKTTLNATNGTYSFPAVDILSTYNLQLSTVNVNTGVVPPATAVLPGAWNNTGDCYGINNMSGTGNKPGTATASIQITTSMTNITAVNFGIERLPDSDDKTVTYGINTPGLQYSIPALSGSDAEDGVLGSGKTYKITSLPASSVLLYNGLVVSLNQLITSFNPLLLKIDPADTVFTASFTYASMDAAGLFDPTPATVLVNWAGILPVTLIDFNGKLNGSKVDLFWKTASELNSNHFEVERSSDAQEFKFLVNVKAKGTSSTETAYSSVDPLPLKGYNYYRLKTVDNDATYVYSKIIIIKVNSDATLETRVMPNPFTGKLDIYLTLPHSCNVSFRFLDASGKVVYTKQVKGLKGFNWFVVNDLEKLPTAPYILNVVTDEKTFTQKLIKQ